MVVRSKFRNGAFKPVERMDKTFEEGQTVEIEIREVKKFAWRGALKATKETSVKLQHKIKEMW